MSADDWDAMVTVGRIVRPQGRHGEVVVAPETDFGDERFRPGQTLWTHRAGSLVAVTVAGSWPHQSRWVLALAGVESIEDADTWRGAELRVPAEALPPLASGAFYVHDLLGCRVETTAGVTVGVVGRVDLGGGTPLLAVDRDGGEVLVPLAETICRQVDLGAKVITIDPPEGLIELNLRRPSADGTGHRGRRGGR